MQLALLFLLLIQMHMKTHFFQRISSKDDILSLKVTPLVYAIYFPTIDFFQIFFDNTTISTSYYVNCFFAKKSLIFFLNGH